MRAAPRAPAANKSGLIPPWPCEPIAISYATRSSGVWRIVRRILMARSHILHVCAGRALILHGTCCGRPVPPSSEGRLTGYNTTGSTAPNGGTTLSRMKSPSCTSGAIIAWSTDSPRTVSRRAVSQAVRWARLNGTCAHRATSRAARARTSDPRFAAPSRSAVCCSDYFCPASM
jgi:hypothetical protein